MKHVRSFALCLAILGVGLPASADIKAFNGAICQAAGNFSQNSIYYDAVFGARAETNMEVACPLIRDRINSTTSLSSVVVELFNETSSGDHPTCTVYAQVEDSAGSYIDFDTASTTTSGFAQLTFSLSATNGNEGSYGMQCWLGTNDQIPHIMVNESNAATD